MKKKLLLGTLVMVSGLTVTLYAVFYMLSYHPADVQDVPIIEAKSPPVLQPGQQVKLMSFNVQYMAGKKYFFWYESSDGGATDTRPTRESIARTIQEVARVIRDEDPDFVLLQEVNDGAVLTDREDQLARLLPLLQAGYVAHASAFYWKADFVPHWRILGPVGMKLSTLSKYQLTRGRRHQLPRFPKDPFTRLFYFQRCVLEVRAAVAGGGELAVLNTHFDAWGGNTGVMAKQVAKTSEILAAIADEGTPFVIGGDFNLLPPDVVVERMPAYQRPYVKESPELRMLYDQFQAVPSASDITGAEYQRWYTHFANNPMVTAPDKTIDYFFLSPDLKIQEKYVRQHDTQHISDHLPVVVTVRLPDQLEATNGPPHLAE